MSDDDQHLLTLFSAALDCESAAERAAYLDRACGQDPALRARVESLLRAHEEVGRFLEAGPAESPIADGAIPPTDAAAADLEAGAVVAGRYKLLEVIGEGGMGTVWLAEQQEPVRRKVALKVIKSGMDSRQVLARFEAERQALALMDHPNIARVLDGGATADGRPFFAMELVKGVPLTRYCDEKRLNPKERLELFVPVCQAVQHAHQKGVIHRDLKPSNVLAAPYDGRPVPKVIDFGVAKATGQSLTEKTLFTGLGAVVGTPEYMSPEQAELNNQDIDTRSDIYSLGVLLYELLTGTTPLTHRRVKDSALLEVLRAVREEEPPKPSTRLSSTEDLSAIAAQRRLEPAKLTKLVRGELDWIVMKCLEKDRNRRYETANSLARDLQRYLADEAVQACPPSARYRLRKFLRRNKRPVLAVAAIALALMVGIAVSSWQAVRATLAEGAERGERNRAVQAEADARQEQRQTKATLARMALDRGLSLGEQGDVSRALLWLARGLEFAHEAENPDLQQVLRRNLAGWQREVHPWRAVFLHGEMVASAAFSPDGKTIATASYDHTARLWDVATGKPITPPMPHGDGVHAVAFSPDGKMVVTGSNDHTARLWHVATGKPIGPPLRHNDIVRGVVFSPDGKTVVTADGSKRLREWEVSTGKPIEPSSKGPPGSADRWVFSKDGKVLLGGETSGSLWDTASGKPLGPRPPHSGVIMSVAVSPDGKTVVTGGNTEFTARHWELNTAKPIGSPMQHPDRVNSVAFSPDGTMIATGGHDGSARLWDAATGKQIGSPLEHGADLFSVAFSPDGKTLLTGCADGTARLWSVADKWPETPLAHRVGLLAAAFSRDGKTVLTSTRSTFTDCLVHLWDPATGLPRCEPRNYKSKVSSVAWSPDGGRILAGTQNYGGGGNYLDHQAWVWDAITGKHIGPALEHRGIIYSVAFSSDGQTLLTGCEDGKAQLWDAATGKPIGPPLEHRGSVLVVAFSPDGKTVVTGTVHHRVATLWDVATRKQIGPPLQHEGHVLAVAFSPDGQTLLTGCRDGMARLWDVATGKPLGPPLQHQGSILAVAFSPDGKTLLTGGRDKSARLWDLATGKQVGPPLQHPDFVHAVGFSPDGKVAHSVSAKCIVRRVVAAPVQGEMERITLWVQVATGLQLDQDGLVRRVIPKPMEEEASWQERVRRLEELGGAPALEPDAGPEETLAGTPHFSKGNVFRTQGNLEACIREYEKGLERDPKNAEAKWALLLDRLTLGDANKKSGNAARAKEHFSRAEALHEQIADASAKRAAAAPDNPDLRRLIAASYVRLGQALQNAGLIEKAEAAYHGHRAITDKLVTDFPKEWLYRSDQIWIRSALCQLLEAAGRSEETETLFAQNLAFAERFVADFPEPRQRTLQANIRRERGQFYSRAGRYREAAADYAEGIRLMPDDPVVRYQNALALLGAGDRGAYRTTCAGMLEHFGQSPNTDAGYWTVWTCILAPDAVTDGSLLVQFAEKMLAADPKNYDRLNALGMVLYRAGRFEDAAKRLAEAEAAFKEAKTPRGTITYTRLFQAMTEHRLGHVPEAKQHLERAVKEIDQPAPDRAAGANAPPWNRRLTLQLLRREAEDLLKRDSGSKRE